MGANLVMGVPEGVSCCVPCCCGIFVGRRLHTASTVDITVVAHARHVTASRQRPITASTWVHIIQPFDIISKNLKLSLSIYIPLDVDANNINAPHFIRTASSILALISPHSPPPTY